MDKMNQLINCYKFEDNLKVGPIERIKRYFRRKRWARERAEYGICQWDIWNGADVHFAISIRNFLVYYLETHHTYPGDNQFDTVEKWEEYLNKIVQRLDSYIDFIEKSDNGEIEWSTVEDYNRQYDEKRELYKEAIWMFFQYDHHICD